MDTNALSLPYDVFISYARRTASKQARALHDKLSRMDMRAFLDERDIEAGAVFPKVLADAVLSSKTFVLLADAEYFCRWYCLQELQIALAPFLRAPQGALDHIIVVRISDDCADYIQRLPPAVHSRHWPLADDSDAIIGLVAGQRKAETISMRLRALGVDPQFAVTLANEARLPRPDNLSGLRRVPVHLPPSLGERFVGRADDLWRIDFWLRTARINGTHAAITAALEASGGFGKTCLALEYVHRFARAAFPGGVFWINADVEQDGLEEQFYEVVRAISAEVPPLDKLRRDRVDISGLLARVLDTLPTEEPALFVVDNIPAPRDGQPPERLEHWCPALGRVTVLATSRSRLSVQERGVVSLPVNRLSNADGVRLLLLDSGFSGELEEAEWASIVDWVGGLPLALVLLNRILVTRAMSPKELLKRTQSRDSVFQSLQSCHRAIEPLLPRGSLRGIAETFDMTYGALTPEQQYAARLLAWLSPEPIPYQLLDRMGEVFSPETRAALLARSIVTSLDARGGLNYGSIHRVISAYLRHRADDPSAEILQWVRAMIRPTVCEDTKALLAAYRAITPHMAHVFQELSRLGVAQAQPELSIELGILLVELGELGGVRLPYEAVHAMKRWLTPDSPVALRLMALEAQMLGASGEFEAKRSLLEKLLERCHAQGAEASFRINVELSLASVLNDLNDQDGCIQWLDRIEHEIKKAERSLSANDGARAGLGHSMLVAKSLRTTVLLARRELATVDVILQGLFADPVVKDADHLPALIAKSPLIALDMAREDWATAAQRLERLMDGVRAVSADEFLSVETSQAYVWTQLGRTREALIIQRRYLEVVRRLYGPKHAKSLGALTAIGMTLRQRGKHRSAAVILEHVLAAHGPSAPARLDAVAELAETYLRAGKRDRAQKLLMPFAAARGTQPAEHGSARRLQSLLESALRAEDELLHEAIGVSWADFNRATGLLALLADAPVPLALLWAIEPFVFEMALRRELEQASVLGTPTGNPPRMHVAPATAQLLAARSARDMHEDCLAVSKGLLHVLALNVCFEAKERELPLLLVPHAQRVVELLGAIVSAKAWDDSARLHLRFLLLHLNERSAPQRALHDMLAASKRMTAGSTEWIRDACQASRMVFVGGEQDMAGVLMEIVLETSTRIYGNPSVRHASASLTLADLLELSGSLREAGLVRINIVQTCFRLIGKESSDESLEAARSLFEALEGLHRILGDIENRQLRLDLGLLIYDFAKLGGVLPMALDVGTAMIELLADSDSRRAMEMAQELVAFAEQLHGKDSQPAAAAREQLHQLEGTRQVPPGQSWVGRVWRALTAWWKA